MKVYIDPDICTGCELCVGICPEVFEVKGMYSVVKVNPVPPEYEEACREAAKDCPVPAGIMKAIMLSAGLALPKNVAIEILQR